MCPIQKKIKIFFHFFFFLFRPNTREKTKNMQFSFPPPTWEIYQNYNMNIQNEKYFFTDTLYLPSECTNLILEFLHFKPLEVLPFLIGLWSWDEIPSWYTTYYPNCLLTSQQAIAMMESILFPELSTVLLEEKRFFIQDTSRENVAKKRKRTKKQNNFIFLFPHQKKVRLFELFIGFYLSPTISDSVVTTCWLVLIDYMFLSYPKKIIYLKLTVFMFLLCLIQTSTHSMEPHPGTGKPKSRLQLLLKLWIFSLQLSSSEPKEKQKWIIKSFDPEFLNQFTVQFHEICMPMVQTKADIFLLSRTFTSQLLSLNVPHLLTNICDAVEFFKGHKLFRSSLDVLRPPKDFFRGF